MTVLPDTSCWIEFFRPHGDPAVRAQLLAWLEADVLVLCGPVRAEVLRGARKAEAGRIDAAFAALPYMKSMDEDWKTVEQKARALADEGRHVPLLDLLIAVVAQRHGAVLAHKDAHFDAIGGKVPVRLHSFLVF